MKKTSHTIIIPITAALLLSACSDGQGVGSADTRPISEPFSESTTESAENNADNTDIAVSVPNNAPDSQADPLAALRSEISEKSCAFAAAYLGFCSEIDGAALSSWLGANSKSLLEKYPFISDIPEDHVVGNSGNLFCIVPCGEECSVAVNRVYRNGDSEIYSVGEVAFRSDSGDPLLVFCGDNVFEPDTSVIIVSDGGKTACEWFASLSERGKPEHDKLLDITDAPAADPIGEYMSCEWLGPTEYGLTGGSSTAWLKSDGGKEYILAFGIDGTVTLDRLNSSGHKLEESLSGQWSVTEQQDKPTMMTISLSDTLGGNSDSADAHVNISGTYPVLISPSGAELILFRGDNGAALPCMGDGDLFSGFNLLN